MTQPLTDLEARAQQVALDVWREPNYDILYKRIHIGFLQLALDKEAKVTQILSGNVSKMEALLASFTAPTQG